MKSVRRLVLLLLLFWGGALGVIVFAPGWSGEDLAEVEVVRSLPGGDSGEELEIRPEPAKSQSREAPRPAVDPPTPDEAIARLLRQRVDLADPRIRREVVAKIRRLEELKGEQTRRKAAQLGIPLEGADGAVLVGFEGDLPLYDVDHNENAAISTGADLLRESAPYRADGAGFAIGLWEAGDVPRLTHQEFGERITVHDSETSTDLHATHVAGTLIAAGLDPLVKGMAPAATIKAHNTVSDVSEMTLLAAAAAGEAGSIYLSNHSYGSAVGWNEARTAWYGTFSDDGNPSNDHASLFGRYSSTASSWDGLAWNAPYYVIFKSAGNDRNDAAPDEGATWKLNNSASSQYPYDSLAHPTHDYSWQIDGGTDGFGTIGPRGSAKNIVTVGSVSDAVQGGIRSAGVASLNSFSSAGPTDDGRIKPDLMANGNSLLSCDDDSDTDTAVASGTSMASPNACGSALLLIDYYDRLFPGQALLASTLKGLLLHTADDLGNPGPDYRFGWGLMNVKAAAEVLQDHAAFATESRFEEGELDGAHPFHEVTVPYYGSGPLRFTICWTDPAGPSTTAHDSKTPRLVHDLNLTVTGPGETTHLPYVMPWVGDWTDATLDDPAVTGVNAVDNVEQVFLDAPAAGEYTIRIDHAGVLAQGSQKFSLIVSGARIVSGPPVVRVDNPVGDMEFLGDSTEVISEVADVHTVFSGSGHSYDVSVSPAGIVEAVLDGDGTVDLTPTATQFGIATVTLTATDEFENVAQDSFEVTIASPILYVDEFTPAAEGSQDGFSWASAFAHLQDALGVAQSGQQIWVAAGMYYPNLANGQPAGGRDETFVIPAGVSLFGGFIAGAVSVQEAQPDLYHTHLSGDIDGNDGPPPGSYAHGLSSSSTETNSYIVVDLSACASGAVFDGFVVSGGYALGTGKTRGGGLHSTGGSATISRCTIAGNHSAQEGAGIYLNGGTPVVTRCRITGNWVGSNGGGLWAESSTVVVHACEFRGNTSFGAGGLGVNGGSLQAVNCLFSGGKGFFGSGGVQIEAGDLTLTNCTITANYSSAAEGGGLLVNGSSAPVQVKNCIIWKNRAANETSPGSSIGYGASPAPEISHSLIHNSGGSGAWNPTVGVDLGGNLDGDPEFIDPIAPNLFGDEGGDFDFAWTSLALNAGDAALLPADQTDLDHDGDLTEPVPLALGGTSRVASISVDQGAFEFGDLDLIDADQDGMADSFELAAGGTLTGLDPLADPDGNALTALAEYVHGHPPGAPQIAPVTQLSTSGGSGQGYLTITYIVRDSALYFNQVGLERRTDLTDPYGWSPGETVQVSSLPLGGGLTRIVARSIHPMGTTRYEFVRLRQSPMVP